METLKEKTAKGLFWGGISNGMVQVCSLLFGIVLARLLNASDYGMVGMLSIFTAVAGTLQESGFTSALANKREVRHEDYNAVFWFSFLCGLSMYCVLFFCAPLIARFYNKPELTPLARYVFLGFVFSSTATAHSAYLFRNLMVKQRAKATIPALLVSGVVGIALAYSGFAYWGLATQSLVYVAVTNFSYWHYSHWRPTLHIDFRPLRSMFAFSSKLLITNIFTQVNNNFLSALLGRFYSVGEVGHFTQSNKWCSIASYFISGTANSVAQPVLASVADDRARQCNVLRKMLRFTAFLSFPALSGLALVAHEFIVITITDKWLPCVPLMQTLCLWWAAAPVATLYGNLLMSKGKSDTFMWNTIAISLLQLCVIFFSHSYGIAWMIRCYVALNVLYVLVWQHFVYKETGLRLLTALKDIAPFAAVAAVAMGAAWAVAQVVEGLYACFAVKIVVAAAVYLGVMKVLRVKIFDEALQFLTSRLHK